MTWENFQCLPVNLKGKESAYFAANSITDEAAILLKKDQAKADLLTDLEHALSLSLPDQMNVIEEILDDARKLAKLREALSCRQLYWFFVDNSKGEGSQNDVKAKFYKSEYQAQKVLFAGLKSATGMKSTMVVKVQRG